MIIPKPLSIQTSAGVFSFSNRTPVCMAFGNDPGYAWFVADELAQCLRDATGSFVITEPDDPDRMPAGSVVLTDRDAPHDLGDEGYSIDIAPQRITLRAIKPAGLFYAWQSLKQLTDCQHATVEQGEALRELTCMHIRDKPRFGWRGFMLDSARHYQPFESILRLIDRMAELKLNRFHWHLTEDQGWRLEVLGYPKLTGVGAWRSNGRGRYGGYYTQEQVRDVVAYARMRRITVIPEIEMPGHNLAALAAYPDLGCNGRDYEVTRDWGVLDGVYCAANEKTYHFLENVLKEVADLFPSGFLHIGGDERKAGLWDGCPRCRGVRETHGLADESALQKWFMQRITDHVHTSLHRRTIAWGDNIDHGGLDGQIVHGWLPEQAAKAARQGHDTINSTHEWVYLDYPQTEQDQKDKKPDWMRLLTLEKAYAFDPIPEGLEPEHHGRVLGSEAHLWTEHVPDEAELYHQVFPRLYAFSEAVWSEPGSRDFDDFQKRLAQYPSKRSAP